MEGAEFVNCVPVNIFFCQFVVSPNPVVSGQDGRHAIMSVVLGKKAGQIKIERGIITTRLDKEHYGKR